MHNHTYVIDGDRFYLDFHDDGALRLGDTMRQFCQDVERHLMDTRRRMPF